MLRHELLTPAVEAELQALMTAHMAWSEARTKHRRALAGQSDQRAERLGRDRALRARAVLHHETMAQRALIKAADDHEAARKTATVVVAP